MCGIALILSGSIQIDTSLLPQISSSFTSTHVHQHKFESIIDDLKAALRRRGPDSLGTKKLFLQLEGKSGAELLSNIVDDEETKLESSCNYDARGENETLSPNIIADMYFIGAVLQLRGTSTVVQPLTDASGNVLIYNGEIFSGIHMNRDSNDTEVLMRSLGDCCSCRFHETVSNCVGKPIHAVLSSIKGPWAVIYWQNTSRTLWFGRDAFGRRSLLVHWPTSDDSRLLLSSVSAPSSAAQSLDSGSKSTENNQNYWEELPCGIYSICMDASRESKCLLGIVRKHEWENSMLKQLIKWDRMLIEPEQNLLSPFVHEALQPSGVRTPAHIVLDALRKSVARRTSDNAIFKADVDDAGKGNRFPVAVLFSGGLDSMILAAILHECLDTRCGIDLLNISFEGEAAPDRITARAGVKELKTIAPLRKWRLVEIDASLSNLTMEMKHVMSLITPSNTYMDLNIGLALWLAAGGDGRVYDTDSCCQERCKRIMHKSEARILLVGSGADEQCAGYGRHRTKYRNSSWFGLHEEMKLDMQRIWKRNLGRDDRCIADNGKEARFPFLDEDVIRVLLDFPLWEICNLGQPSGTGDKKILREVARLLGLHEAAVQPKRAIQFGSRIAQESNRKNFGSNRAANQASAGSVVIYK